MKIILIQGCPNTGKTTLCNNFDYYIRKKLKAHCIRKKRLGNGDFWGAYNINQKGVKKRIIINSYSDGKRVIRKFERQFYQKYRVNDNDILITAIRPQGDIYHNVIKGIYNNEPNKQEYIIDLDGNLLSFFNQLNSML
jgi:hypothetical protein